MSQYNAILNHGLPTESLPVFSVVAGFPTFLFFSIIK